MSYAGNGSTTTFSVNFYFIEQSHLKVILRSSAGVETVKTLSTDYSVTGAGVPSGGSITMVTAPAVGETLVIQRNVPLTQTTDYQPNDPFPANTHEQALDKLTMETQQLQLGVDRAIKFAETDSTALNNVVPVSNLRANKAMIFDASGNLTVSIDDYNDQAYNAGLSAAAAAASAVAAAGHEAGAEASAIAAAASEVAAAGSASAASVSAASAAASVNAGMYSAVQDKSANYAVVAGDAGDLIRVTTTGGAVTITLPQIGTTGIDDGFKIAVVKWTNDANTVSVVRSGTNTINGTTSYSIGSQYTSATFVADAETGQWFGAASGVGTANIVSDVFSGTGSQTVFTLSGDPGSKNNTFVYVGGVYQQKATYTQSGATITFSTAPPSGTGNVEIIWIQPQAIGVPSDGTVSSAKLAATQLTLPNALNEPASVTLASASTVDIGAASANTITISGTTTITALGTIASGAVRRLVFAGALTLTHNATSLILPGAANITTAAGDVVEFLSLGSGNWRCINYSKASGSSVASSYAGPSATTYTTAGSYTFTIPTGVTKLKVTVVGGGGGAGYVVPCVSSYSGVAGGTSSVASGTQTISTVSATGGAGGNLLFVTGGLGSGGDINARGGGGPSAGSGGGYSSLSFAVPLNSAGTQNGILGAGGAWNGSGGSSGGGGGGTATKWLSGLTPGNTLSVTVGAGGTSGGGGGTGGAGVVIFEY